LLSQAAATLLFAAALCLSPAGSDPALEVDSPVASRRRSTPRGSGAHAPAGSRDRDVRPPRAGDDVIADVTSINAASPPPQSYGSVHDTQL